MTVVNRPRSINGRRRRTKAEIVAIRDAMYGIVSTEYPMTVRQVFYRLVSAGVIGKSENEYKSTVVRLLTDMRVKREMPFDWIADNTRWMRKPTTHSSLEQALRRTVETYRRSVWDNQDVYVEIWLEKDALAGVMYDVTSEWDVPLMVTRGYPSVSFLNSAAENIAFECKPTFLYYFGDHDPSGVDIPRNVHSRLLEFAPSADIHFECVAVNPDQVALWNLPTRPTKRTDTRSRSFRGESVELDAIPPEKLRDLVRTCIEQHVDQRALQTLQTSEASERSFLTNWAKQAEAGA